ncbi:MAG TPA: oligopeptide/dipeptide ABC transporter ATP-binding protein [Actinomycetota bacterium]|jgi:oligopeptide transport system ATP-binding protein|nr:oligopeptide/dipeptide ABC transporter ATP-binding protein [Actinomycetota bacterium]
MSDPQPLIRVDHVVKHFPLNDKVFGSSGVIHAVDDVSVELYPGEVLGLVGESGCGKSTLANLIMRLEEPTSGTIEYLGRDIQTFEKDDLKTYRREVQMVFQDTFGSLDPRMTITDVLTEPFTIHRDVLPKDAWPDKVRALLKLVGLDPDHANRYPHEFSGGQRQRICIARALALDPKVLVCDEPVSALDVSVQAQVVNLLKDLRDEFGLSYVFVAHDLSVVRQIADRVAVMYLGQVQEIGDEEEVLLHPSHPYTQALVSALPTADAQGNVTGKRIVLSGDLPSPADPPSGCRFNTRCWMAQQKCVDEEPELIERGTGRPTKCHFVTPTVGAPAAV